MKNNIAILLLLLLVIRGLGQNGKYELPVRNTPTVNKERISQAKYVTDLTPLLWSSLEIPQDERYYLEQRRVRDYPQPQPTNYLYPQEKYKLTIDYVAVEISVISEGKPVTITSSNDLLTEEQKNILKAAELGTDIGIKIKFKYKDGAADEFGKRDEVLEGKTMVALVPETEAEYPGGYKQLSDYFVASVINKVADNNAIEKVRNAEVKFTVNEEGEIVDAQISRSSTDSKIDMLLLEAMSHMPRWKPAVISNGTKVKQEIRIPFSVGC